MQLHKRMMQVHIDWPETIWKRNGSEVGIWSIYVCETVIRANTDPRRVHREFITVFTSEEVVCWEKLFSLEPQYGTKIGFFFFFLLGEIQRH